MPFQPWSNPTSGFEHIAESDRRQYILRRIESSRWSDNIRIILVCGMGIFLDSYSIFSFNLIIPILGSIYYEGNMPFKYQIALNLSTLTGAFFGHIIFGYIGDRFGRRKTYGMPLSIIIMANLGLTMSSTGFGGSMSLIGWLLVWRTVLGTGIGGEMSMSAVICAEYAPTLLRGKMLTALSAVQPIGQAVACVVTLAAMSGRQHEVLKESTTVDCHIDCKRALDSTWRVIVGVGVFPAALALPLRFTIPESPRFTMNSRRALLDVQRYYNEDVEPLRQTTTTGMEMEHQSNPNANMPNTRNSSTTNDGSEVASMETSPAHSVSVQSLDIEHEYPFSMSKEALQQYFWSEGNIRTIIGTSFTWACTDLPFYALLLNTDQVTAFIWQRSDSAQGSILSYLNQLSWQSIIIAPTGALIGCGITFLSINRIGRRNIQMGGFLFTFLTFTVIGTSFKKLSTLATRGTSPMAVLYVLGQILFAFGPSTTTYILPAELYPTRYRCLGHGISGAFGRLGAIIGQLIFGYMNQNHGSKIDNADSWLPYSILVLSIFLLCGFVFTVLCIPGVEHDSRGRIKSLEDWGVGRRVPQSRTI